MADGSAKQRGRGKVKSALDSLYASMQRAENRVGGGEGLVGIYGSMTQTGTSDIIAAFKEHAGMGSDSILVDIGAGLGRPLLHAILDARVSKTYGVELDAVKCQKAIPFIQHTVAMMEAVGVTLPAASLPKFVCMPAEEMGSLEPATHAYAAWEGFPITAKMAVGELFVRTKSLRSIIIVQRAFRVQDAAGEMRDLGFGDVRLVASIPVYMSGSGRRLNAYMFVKEPEAAAAPPSRAAPAAAGPSLATAPAFEPATVLQHLSASGRVWGGIQQQGVQCSQGDGEADAAGPSNGICGQRPQRPQRQRKQTSKAAAAAADDAAEDEDGGQKNVGAKGRGRASRAKAAPTAAASKREDEQAVTAEAAATDVALTKSTQSAQLTAPVKLEGPHQAADCTADAAMADTDTAVAHITKAEGPAQAALTAGVTGILQGAAGQVMGGLRTFGKALASAAARRISSTLSSPGFKSISTTTAAAAGPSADGVQGAGVAAVDVQPAAVTKGAGPAEPVAGSRHAVGGGRRKRQRPQEEEAEAEVQGEEHHADKENKLQVTESSRTKKGSVAAQAGAAAAAVARAARPSRRARLQ